LGKALFFKHVHWEPPGTWFLLLPLYAVAVAGFVLLMIGASAAREGADPAPALEEPAPGKPAATEATPDGYPTRQLPRIGAV
jgi:hypothetical protein